MGLFSSLLGSAGAIDVSDVETELEAILAEGEKPEQVYKLVRDLIVFTRAPYSLKIKQPEPCRYVGW